MSDGPSAVLVSAVDTLVRGHWGPRGHCCGYGGLSAGALIQTPATPGSDHRSLQLAKQSVATMAAKMRNDMPGTPPVPDTLTSVFDFQHGVS